jgi:hypothetical protein
VINRGNSVGNLDGLLAHHILHDTGIGIDWKVNPLIPAWLDRNSDRLSHASYIAALGYGVAGFGPPSADRVRQDLQQGLAALVRRNPIQADGVTFVNSAKELVGVALAAKHVGDDQAQRCAWLASVLQDPRLGPGTPLLAHCRRHALRVVANAAPEFGPVLVEDDLIFLAGWLWQQTLLGGEPPNPDVLRDVGARLLRGSMLNLPGHLDPPEGALLLRAIERVVSADINALAQSRDNVAAMLREFEDAMRRWRYDRDDLRNPIRWEITSEREVQDILWLMLRPVYRDLVDEEALKKFGHSTYRADFGIPSLGLLIEVKYARSASDFKEFEKQLAVDHAAYLLDNHPYSEMIVFIYDESAARQEYGLTRAALMRLPGVVDVVIVSKPSHVPIHRRHKHPSTTES